MTPTATKPHWSRALVALDACSDAVKWARKQPSYATAWKRCERADWMLWLIEHSEFTGTDLLKLRAIAYACANRAVKIHAPLALESAGIPIEAAKLRALPDICNEATAWAARDAAWATRDAAWAAGAARDARDAAWAAAWAAGAARAARAAGDARAAAWAAAWAAGAAGDAELKHLAALVREHFPRPPKLNRKQEP